MYICCHLKSSPLQCGAISITNTELFSLLQAVGVWYCHDKNCRIYVAGGAWNYSTVTAASVRSAVRRLKELKEA